MTTTKTILTKAMILEASDLPTREVEVPQWGGATAILRTLTGAERDSFETEVDERKARGKGRASGIDTVGMRARFVALILVDENGDRLIEDGDEELIQAKSSAAIDLLFREGQILNGFTDEAVAELEGN